MVEHLWCRNCGGPLLNEGVQQILDVGQPWKESTNLNVMMTCVACVVPDLDLSPKAGKITNRLLYWLIIDGMARVGYPKNWTGPPHIKIHERTTQPEAARSYFSGAIRSVTGFWVATHHRMDKVRGHGYVVGHLKLTNSPCHCKLM